MVINRPYKNKGFIAILSLLIVTTISMVIAMTLLEDGVDNASLSISNIYFENAKLNATVCLEDTLIRIKREDQFNQNLNYTIAEGHSCSSDIQWYTPQQISPDRQETLVNLTVSGTSANFSRTFDYELKVTRVDVNHTDGTLEYVNEIDIISIAETNN